MISDYGFIKTCACAPAMRVADVSFNVSEIIKNIEEAKKNGASIILFPELCITGYTCGDLFQQDELLLKAFNALYDILPHTDGVMVVVGLPLDHVGTLHNTAAVLNNGEVVAFVLKSFLPSYKEYYERRWFHSGLDVSGTYGGIPVETNTIFNITIKDITFKVGIEICEDLWMPISPSSLMSLAGATLILNPSASTETIGKAAYRRELINQNSARNVCAYLYAAAGPNESTSDVVFSGHCLASEYGSLLAESHLFPRPDTMIYAEFDLNKLINERRKLTTFGDQSQLFYNQKYGDVPFEEYNIELSVEPSALSRTIDPTPFIPHNEDARLERMEEILNIQTQGLMTRLETCHADGMVIGVSGGLDSTLALMVAVIAADALDMDRSCITGITMPGFGTTSKTKRNAILLMEGLGIDIKNISIVDACNQHFKDIDLPDTDRSITYENCQARERTQILMDYANKTNKIVLGTGDMSELALGFCTYNGDHMSMYNVNCSIPKTLVKYLVETTSWWGRFENVKEILESICNTTISPELLPPDEKGEIAQKTEDTIGPYKLHDFFLYYHIRWNFSRNKIFYLATEAFKGEYDQSEIYKWLDLFYKRFFASQFKRNCVPDGPKVGSISLSPRGDWRMPSDASSAVWR